MTPAAPWRQQLLALLKEAQALGFLGPGPVEPQLERSLAFAAVVPISDELAVDLGTGGGLPGLALAAQWPERPWLFIEANQRRARWLHRATGALGLSAVTVVAERAEGLGRGAFRASAGLVTARSFGPPAVTAECAAPLLKVGGQLVVTEPPEPGTAQRWPEDGLSLLGLRLVRRAVVPTAAGSTTLTLLESSALTDARFPRKTGAPAKNPLW